MEVISKAPQIPEIRLPEDTDVSEDDVREETTLASREKITFAILMTMSFYAALESTSIGVALPVCLSAILKLMLSSF